MPTRINFATNFGGKFVCASHHLFISGSPIVCLSYAIIRPLFSYSLSYYYLLRKEHKQSNYHRRHFKLSHKWKKKQATKKTSINNMTREREKKRKIIACLTFRFSSSWRDMHKTYTSPALCRYAANLQQFSKFSIPNESEKRFPVDAKTKRYWNELHRSAQSYKSIDGRHDDISVSVYQGQLQLLFFLHLIEYPCVLIKFIDKGSAEVEIQ